MPMQHVRTRMEAARVPAKRHYILLETERSAEVGHYKIQNIYVLKLIIEYERSFQSFFSWLELPEFINLGTRCILPVVSQTGVSVC